jgi:hypothetical protein
MTRRGRKRKRRKVGKGKEEVVTYSRFGVATEVT